MIIGTLSLDNIIGTHFFGEPITETLQRVTDNPRVVLLSQYFGFFALITSFLGVSLSMVDFIADGLGLNREGLSRFGLCLIVFFPPTIFAFTNPGIFIQAIGIAGGFGEAILNGLLPIAIVWVGRYTPPSSK